MAIKAIKTQIDTSLKLPKTQEIMGIVINRGMLELLNEVKKEQHSDYEKGEVNGRI